MGNMRSASVQNVIFCGWNHRKGTYKFNLAQTVFILSAVRTEEGGIISDEGAFYNPSFIFCPLHWKQSMQGDGPLAWRAVPVKESLLGSSEPLSEGVQDYWHLFAYRKQEAQSKSERQLNSAISGKK